MRKYNTTSFILLKQISFFIGKKDAYSVFDPESLDRKQTLRLQAYNDVVFLAFAGSSIISAYLLPKYTFDEVKIYYILLFGLFAIHLVRMSIMYMYACLFGFCCLGCCFA